MDILKQAASLPFIAVFIVAPDTWFGEWCAQIADRLHGLEE